MDFQDFIVVHSRALHTEELVLTSSYTTSIFLFHRDDCNIGSIIFSCQEKWTQNNIQIKHLLSFKTKWCMTGHCAKPWSFWQNACSWSVALLCWTVQSINSPGRYFILKADLHTQVCRYDHTEYNLLHAKEKYHVRSAHVFCYNSLSTTEFPF